MNKLSLKKRRSKTAYERQRKQWRQTAKNDIEVNYKGDKSHRGVYVIYPTNRPASSKNNWKAPEGAQRSGLRFVSGCMVTVEIANKVLRTKIVQDPDHNQSRRENLTDSLHAEYFSS